MGIVPEGVLAKLYEEAYGREEYKASAFWQVFLQRAFYEDKFIVVCEAPPTESSRRRVDIVVRQYDEDHHNLSSLLFNEVKAHQGDKTTVHTQVITAAHLAIEKDGLESIYVMMTIGTQFRAGVVYAAENTIRPIQQFNRITRYVDALSDDADELLDAIGYIKMHPPHIAILNEVPSNAPYNQSTATRFVDYGVEQPGPSSEATVWTAATHGPEAVALSSSAYTGDLSIDMGDIYGSGDVTHSSANVEIAASSAMTESDMMDALFAPRIRVRARVVGGLFSSSTVEYVDEHGHRKTARRSDWKRVKSNGYEAYVLGRQYYCKRLS